MYIQIIQTLVASFVKQSTDAYAIFQNPDVNPACKTVYKFTQSSLPCGLQGIIPVTRNFTLPVRCGCNIKIDAVIPSMSITGRSNSLFKAVGAAKLL